MRQHVSPASRLPSGGFAGLDPDSVLARVRSQAGPGVNRRKLVLIFDEHS